MFSAANGFLNLTSVYHTLECICYQYILQLNAELQKYIFNILKFNLNSIIKKKKIHLRYLFQSITSKKEKTKKKAQK